MLFGLDRWRPRHLLAAWGAYWVTLLLATLSPAMLAVWRATRPDGHGTVSASFGDGALSLVVKREAATLWSGSASFLAVALWLAGPPLVLWLLWALARPRRAALADAPRPAALRESEPGLGAPRPERSDAVPARRDDSA